MAIVSISLNDKILKEIDSLKETQGFAGRSEVIRAAVRSLLSDVREKSKLSGKLEGVLLVMHDDTHTEEANSIRHRYERIIKTHIHNQLKNRKCLEIFVVSGDSDDVRSLSDAFETSKKIGLTKLIVS